VLAAGLTACGILLPLVACSPSSPVFEDAFEKALKASPEAVPPYQQIVADALHNFKQQDDLVDLQISGPAWTEHLGGPAWVVCVKFSPKAKTYYYTFFIRGDRIAEVRFAVGTDRCSGRTFNPFAFTPRVTATGRINAAPVE
jgi:hypothetical protein